MIIAVDMDEVLCEYFATYLKFFNEKFGTNFKREDVTDYEIWNIVGGTYEDTVKHTNEFHESELFKNIPLVSGAKEGISTLKEKHTLFIVTGRPAATKEATLHWVSKHFPETFEDVLFANHWSKEGEEIKKSYFCKQFGAQALIDDCPGYAIDCAELGIKVVMPEKPWNQVDLPKTVIKVPSWKEIVEQLQ